MKRVLIPMAFILFFCCSRQTEKTRVIQSKGDALKTREETATETQQVIQYQYSEKQLISFLDSIGNLPETLFTQKAGLQSDSVFNNQLQLNKILSQGDFNALKKGIAEKELEYAVAKRIFTNFKPGKALKPGDKVRLAFKSFDKDSSDFNEFMVCPDSYDINFSDNLYFFKSNKLLANHHVHWRYGLEMDYYRDWFGQTIVYYKQNYVSGTGVWWYNYYFYTYGRDGFIPVLNEIENGNSQFPWTYRYYWMKATVVKTTPLTLKMVYNVQLPDSSGNRISLVSDSTLVKYDWADNSMGRPEKMEGVYRNSKLTKAQVLSYYVEDNDLMFINAYYRALKSCLNSKTKKKALLIYLNNVKNHNEDL